MKIGNKHYHTIWLSETDTKVFQVIDQRKLPFQFEIFDLKSVENTFYAIKEMVVRGAPLIGVTAAYGMYLALLEFDSGNLQKHLEEKASYLKSSRPTAVNLAFAVDEMYAFILENQAEADLIEKTLQKAHSLKEEEIGFGDKIGEAGFKNY